MSKEEFEIQYSNNSDITLREYHELFITLPCHCDCEYCQGWAAVSNNELSVKCHNDLYNRQ